MTGEWIRTYQEFWKLRLMGGVSRLHNYGYSQSPDKMYTCQVQKLIMITVVQYGAKVILFSNKGYMVLRDINIDTF